MYLSALLPLQAFSMEIFRKVLQVVVAESFCHFAKVHAVGIYYVRKSKLGEPVLKSVSINA